MNLDLTEEQKLIQATAREFATNELAPVAAELDRGENEDVFMNNLKKLSTLGFMGLNVREEFGGAAAGPIAFSLAILELAKACSSTAVTVSVNNMVCEVIQSLGSKEQKKQYITKLCSGEYRAGAFALTEPGAGSDPSAMSTGAVADGNDWIINGSKLFITSGSCASIFVVWAVTDPKASPGKGISLFLIEADAKGLVVGKKEEKMGQHASPTNEIHFQDCRVPGSALIGKINDGYKIAMTELAGGRIGIAALGLGIGYAAMELASSYCLERKQFGKTIAKHQAIQWKIADCYTSLEAGRLLVMNAAFQKEQGRSYARQASMAKLFCTEAANTACYEAIQILGGYGYTKDYPLERYARDVRVTTIYEGTSEIQRMIIAREILKQFS